jgi:hypothetical protein
MINQIKGEVMTKSELKQIASQLVAGSKTLQQVAAPDADGFKAVSSWLYARESQLSAKYGICRKDIYQLTFAVNAIGTEADESLSLED